MGEPTLIRSSRLSGTDDSDCAEWDVSHCKVEPPIGESGHYAVCALVGNLMGRYRAANAGTGEWVSDIPGPWFICLCVH